jgi:hypothetical protein
VNIGAALRNLGLAEVGRAVGVAVEHVRSFIFS